MFVPVFVPSHFDFNKVFHVIKARGQEKDHKNKANQLDSGRTQPNANVNEYESVRIVSVTVVCVQINKQIKVLQCHGGEKETPLKCAKEQTVSCVCSFSRRSLNSVCLVFSVFFFFLT